MNELFQGGIEIIKTFKRAGFEAYFVGGCVRDKLLNNDIHDVDITTNATPKEMMQLFEKTIPVGLEHGTVMIKMGRNYYEVSTYKSSHHEQPTLLSDLAHRDFTVNALALTENFEIIDPYDFQSDIERKMIRAVHDPEARFNEDPLRMLRAIRFVAQLGFRLEEKTKNEITKQYHKLSTVANERITKEIEKILLGKNVRMAIQLLIETNLHKQIAFLQDEKMLKRFSQIRIEKLRTIEERWAALFYFSESQTVPPIYVAREQKKEIKTILSGVLHVLTNGWSDFFIYKNGLVIAQKILRLLQLIQPTHSMTEKELQLLYEQLPIKERSELCVTGKDFIQILDKKQGAWVRELLEKIERAVVEKKLANDKGQILAYVRGLKQREV